MVKDPLKAARNPTRTERTQAAFARGFAEGESSARIESAARISQLEIANERLKDQLAVESSSNGDLSRQLLAAQSVIRALTAELASARVRLEAAELAQPKSAPSRPSPYLPSVPKKQR